MHANQLPPTAFPPQVPATPSQLEGVNNDLAMQVMAVRELRDQARAIADSYFGVQPTAVSVSSIGISTSHISFASGSGMAIGPVARISATRNTIADLGQAIEQLRHELERLACI